MKTVHDGGNRSGADFALSENSKDVVGCLSEHAIRRRDVVFLSYVLQLRCLHEDYHGSIVTRPP